MKIYLFTALGLLFLFTRPALPAACCLSGTPRTFIDLQPMENYEIGLSTTYRSVTGYYNQYGELDGGSSNQTFTWLWGAGARLAPSLEAFVGVPLVYQHNGTGPSSPSAFDLGDMNAGVKFTWLRRSGVDEGTPTVYVLVGTKAPTGDPDRITASRFIPGTGNGLWEVFVGLGAQKDLGVVSLAASVLYTSRVNSGATSRVDDGDSVEAFESLSLPLSRRFALAVGSEQTWTLSRWQNGAALSEAAGRTLTVFVSPTYFPTRFWSIQFSLEGPPPLANVGVNDVEATSLSLISKVAFF